jgi:hypothetical protein
MLQQRVVFIARRRFTDIRTSIAANVGFRDKRMQTFDPALQSSQDLVNFPAT